MINNKYIQNIFVSFFLMASLFVSAQFTLNSHNNGWVQVNGSSGVTVKNVVVNQLQMNGPLNIKNWSIVGRVVSPICGYRGHFSGDFWRGCFNVNPSLVRHDFEKLTW